jgi:guanylate kinase
MRKRGLLFVLSAPSGVGKSTIYKRLLRTAENLTYSVSTTTRPPRKNEVEGRDYYFVTEEKFRKLVQKGEFIEWARVHGNLYGTSKAFIKKTVESGKDVVLDIDVQGGMNLKKRYPDAVLIFIMAPTFREIARRLKERNKDTSQTIELRLKNARREVSYIPRYNYLVINDDLNVAVNDIKAVMKSEHLKTDKSKSVKF